MYAVGEYVVHPGQGVCKVEGMSSDNSAYQLVQVGQRNPMHLSVPVASEGRLRPVLSRGEAQRLIEDYDSLEPEDAPRVAGMSEEELYRERIRTGSCRDNVRIVKTFRARIADVKARNKKPPVAYERILKRASQRSLSELAVALGTTPEDVVALFEAQEGEEPSQN